MEVNEITAPCPKCQAINGIVYQISGEFYKSVCRKCANLWESDKCGEAVIRIPVSLKVKQ